MKKIIHTLLLAGSLLLSALVQAQDATTLYNEGIRLKGEKKVSEALAKFQQAVALKADYYAAYYECGWCYNDQKKYTNAIESLRKARHGWSAIPKVYFELGYAFQKTELVDSAIKCYARTLELKSDYSLAYKQLGYIYYDKEEYEKAVNNFLQYESNAKVEINDYLYWYRKGFTYNALKQFSNAITALEKSLGFKKDYINTYLELGFAATRLKTNNDVAISYFKKAIELDPKSHIAYNGIGEVYRDNIKDRNEAMNWYEKTLSINPNERKANYGMGYCLNSGGQYAEAISYIKKAIQYEPGYTAAYVELGYSYFKTDQLNMAIEQLNKAISLNASNENARYYLTLIYIKQKNKTMAQKMVNELKNLSSKHVTELQQKVNAM